MHSTTPRRGSLEPDRFGHLTVDTIRHDDALSYAVAWLVRRFRVPPARAGLIAELAGIGEQL